MEILKRQKNRVTRTMLFLVLTVVGFHLLSAQKIEAAGNKFEELGGVAEITPEIEKTVSMIRKFWKRENETSIKELDIRPFKVPPRKDEFEYFPCMECHEEQQIKSERVLTEEHEDVVLDHGKKRFWCLTCHFAKNDKDYLRSLKGNKIDFDQSYLLCGQCHFQRQKDWFMGAHGKRVGRWYGERVILSCVECHNPHSPSIKPKFPDPIPKGIREIRAERNHKSIDKEVKREMVKVWDRIATEHNNKRAK